MFTIQIPTPDAIARARVPVEPGNLRAHREVNGHGMKPPQRFRAVSSGNNSVGVELTPGSGRIYAGVEVEMVTDHPADFLTRLTVDMKPWMRVGPDRLWHAERDGSLPRDRGIEIPLMPWAVTTLAERNGAYRFYDAFWASLMRHRQGRGGIDQCGMHIHTSRNGVRVDSREALVIEALVSALMTYTPGQGVFQSRMTQAGSVAIGRPAGGQTSYFSASNPPRPVNGERFRAVNRCNTGTIEARAFGPAEFIREGWLSTAVDIITAIRLFANTGVAQAAPVTTPLSVLLPFALWLRTMEWPYFPRACAHLRLAFPTVFNDPTPGPQPASY